MEEEFPAMSRYTFVTDMVSGDVKKDFDEKNAHQALQITRWHLKFLGIWPLSVKSSYFEKIFTYVMISTCSSLLIFILAPGTLFIVFKAENSYMAIKMFGALSFCVMAILKYNFLLSRREDIARCIKHLVSDWNRRIPDSNRVIMKNCAEYGRKISMICAIFMYSGGVFYSGVLPYVSLIAGNEKNATSKPLAYPSYYIWFDVEGDVAYVIVFVTQCCCSIVMLTITSVSCNIAVVFAMHAYGQLKIITKPFYIFFNNTKKYDKFDEVLVKIIKHHVRTLRFISDIGCILSGICLVEIVGCTLVICLLEYYFLLEWEDSDFIGIITYMTLMMSLTFNIFLFCFFGNLLTNECRNVGDKIYMIDWDRLSAKCSRQLILMILISQKTVSMTSGKMINLSLATFLSAIRTSVVYLNFLRQVTE